MIDLDKARLWLDTGDHDLELENFTTEDAVDFIGTADSVIDQASSARLFGDDLDVSLFIVADGSIVLDGALLVVSLGRGGEEPAPRLRLASYFLGLDELAVDWRAEGVELAVSVLEAASLTIDQMLDDYTQRLAYIATQNQQGGPS